MLPAYGCFASASVVRPVRAEVMYSSSRRGPPNHGAVGRWTGSSMTANAWPAFYAGDHLGAFNWWMRLVTGGLAAWGTAFFTFPWMDRLLKEEQGRIPTE